MKKNIYTVAHGCTLCGTCVVECPVGAIFLGPQGARIDKEKCTGCGTCLRNCASEAIEKTVTEKED
jgi:uncharacterized Fe-S center protein